MTMLHSFVQYKQRTALAVLFFAMP
jgi:hypothetical protein